MRLSKNKWVIYIGIIFVITILAGWLFSRALALFYQSRATRYIQQAIDQEKKSHEIMGLCIKLNPNAEETQDLLLRAADAINMSLRINPKLNQSWLMRGRAYCLLGDLDEAIYSYNIYTQNKPKNPLGHLELGLAYGALNYWDDAFKQWISAGISTTDLLDVGRQAEELGDINRAQLWYELAAQYDPFDQIVWDAWLDLGLKLEREQRWAEALDLYQSAVDLQSLKRVQHYSAKFFLHMGIIQQWYLTPTDREQALKSFQAAIADGGINNLKDEVDLHLYLGFLYWWKRPAINPDLYIQEFKRVLSLDPKHYWAHLMLGQVHMEDFHDLEKAKSYIDEAINLQINNPWGYLFLGDIYLKKNQPEIAAQYYEKAISLDSDFQQAKDRLQAMKGSQDQ